MGEAGGELLPNPTIKPLTEQNKPPKFIREFSKEVSPEARSALAREAQAKLSKARDQLGGAEALTPETLREEATAEDLLMAAGMTYKEAQNPIGSMEYLEKFFNLHPELKPKRIVYYHGDNPTKAFRDWREENGLTNKSEEPDMGFSERKILDYDDPRATRGMKRFRSIGLKVIEEHFSGEE